jgi:hypothetical protein
VHLLPYKSSAQNAGTINLAAGGTLSVGQAAWTNYGMINMTGGAHDEVFHFFFIKK